MFKYLVGKISEIEIDNITIEVNNIGYEVYVANVNEFNIDENTKVYIYNHIKEDAFSLFGFKSNEELSFYKKLISVKGIGPKIAMVMMSGNINELQNAIVSDDTKYLSSFSGVGPKAAKQIILDLSNKLGDINVNTQISVNNEELKMAIETLISLGYKKSQIKSIEKELKEFNSEAQMVKYALANL